MAILDIASRFVSKNATLPILQNIYLKASIDTLIIRATDMEKYVEIEAPCNILLEGSITVNARTFLDILKTLESDQVELSAEAKTDILTIKTEKDTFEINGLPAVEYVALPEIPQQSSFIVDTTLFSKGISDVEYAITEKSFSPVLTGVLIKSRTDGDQSLVFVGSDSFRLAEYKIANRLGQDFSLIIPKVSITDIKTLLDYAVSKEVEEMKLNYSENLVAISLELDGLKIVATSLLIQGSFPAYEREEVMPTSFVSKIMMDRQECEKAIKKIWILTKDINNLVQIDMEENKVIISSGGKRDKGAGTTQIPAIVEGERFSFAVNGRYITDFIRTMESDTLIFNLNSNQKPILLQDKDNTTTRYIIRPLINN